MEYIRKDERTVDKQEKREKAQIDDFIKNL